MGRLLLSALALVAACHGWESPIITSSVNAGTASSVAESLGQVVATAPARMPQHVAVAVAAAPAPPDPGPSLVCGVCSKALDMARAIMLGESVNLYQTQGLPGFAAGVCSDLKVDYKLSTLECGSVASRISSLYASAQLVSVKQIDQVRGW
jgi:hypothetical protein